MPHFGQKETSMKVGIDYLSAQFFKRIEKICKDLPPLLKKVHDPDQLRPFISWTKHLSHDQAYCLNTCSQFYFLMERKFWESRVYPKVSFLKRWARLEEEPPHQNDLAAFLAKTKEYHAEYGPALKLGDSGVLPFSLEDEEFNRERIQLAKIPHESQALRFYNTDPKARYATELRQNLYYISHDGASLSENLLRLLMHMELYDEAGEVIFRMKHAYGRGEVKDGPGNPKLKHLTPGLYMYEAWLQARLESDPRKRFELGWRALYWLLWGYHVTYGTSYGFSYDLSAACCIIGDFDLFGDRQIEFLQHFKLYAMRSCPTTCRRLMAEPTRVIPWSELGLPTWGEIKRMYAELG